MSELKFRVWDKKAKRMEEGFALFGEFTLLGGVHSWQKESGIDGNLIERLADLIEMQFVGIVDKNGKDIYEGDIIEMRKKKSKSDEPFFVGQIKNKGWLGFDIETDDDFMDFEAPNMTYKVIGNIYENPELLKT